MHSVSSVHIGAQAVGPQTLGAHERVRVLHTPPPSHTIAISVPAVQLEAPHVVPAAYFWQPPAPSHRPFVPQLFIGCIGQPGGLGVPAAAIGRHEPAMLATLQDRHGPAHTATSQQTLSTQLPELHSLLSVQAVPSG